MTKNKRIAFLCSGAGGNFHFIRVCIEKGLLPGAVLAGAIVDRNSSVGQFCQAHGIPSAVATFKRVNQWDELAPILEEMRPDIIVTNVHKIIDKEVLGRSPCRLVNLHYSLLPAFGGVIGMKTLEQAIEYGVKIIGCTAHEVTAEVDGGAPIAQVALPLDSADGVTSQLTDMVFRAAALCLFGAIVDSDYMAAPVTIHGRSCLYSGPEFNVHGVIENASIWSEVREGASFGRDG